MGYRELTERRQAAALIIGESAPFQAHLAEETQENGVDRSLGCRGECSAGRVRLTLDGKLLLGLGAGRPDGYW